MDVYILQDLFNTFDVKRKSFLICTQCNLSKLPEMVENKSLGASIMGRIIGRAKIVTITGPNIRLMGPAQKPKDFCKILHFERSAYPLTAVYYSFWKR